MVNKKSKKAKVKKAKKNPTTCPTSKQIKNVCSRKGAKSDSCKFLKTRCNKNGK